MMPYLDTTAISQTAFDIVRSELWTLSDSIFLEGDNKLIWIEIKAFGAPRGTEIEVYAFSGPTLYANGSNSKKVEKEIRELRTGFE